MTPFDWFLIVLWLVSALANILVVGRPRDPMTPGTAAASTVVALALIAGLLLTRGAL